MQKKKNLWPIQVWMLDHWEGINHLHLEYFHTKRRKEENYSRIRTSAKEEDEEGSNRIINRNKKEEGKFALQSFGGSNETIFSLLLSFFFLSFLLLFFSQFPIKSLWDFSRQKSMRFFPAKVYGIFPSKSLWDFSHVCLRVLCRLLLLGKKFWRSTFSISETFFLSNVSSSRFFSPLSRKLCILT